MDSFAVLTNRKRAIVALVHSYVFLGVAVLTSMRQVRAFAVHGPHPPGSIAMIGIYSAVTLVLLTMVGFSGCGRERLYFGFCTTSAGVGLLRGIAGDATLHGFQYTRILALALTIAVCTTIVRGHSHQELELAPAEE